MFDRFTNFDNIKADTGRKFDPYNEHNQAQAYTDAIGGFGAMRPLQDRMRALLDFYKSNENSDTNFNGA